MIGFLRLNQRAMKRWLSKRRVGQSLSSRRRKNKIISILAGLIIVTLVSGMVGTFGVLAYFSHGLPSPDTLSTRQVPETTKIYARDGTTLLYEVYGDERRTLVKLEDIPEYLKQATVATEDKDFYTHKGFDMLGMIRGIFRTVQGEGLQGGSTITQQVVKNTLLTQERTITRKIKEFILAIQLERTYTKDQILQMYLNESPYGGQAWGVGAASEMYFGKNVKDLTLAEVTLMAGLPQSPSYYSPCGAYPENAKARQAVVLNLMIRNGGYITEQERDEVLATEIPVVCFGYNQADLKAPHFVMFVKDELTKLYGEKIVEQGGLKVTTSLDWTAQELAQTEAKTQIDKLIKAGANATNASVMVTDPKTGQILAMVGSVDYWDVEHDGNVNGTLSDQLQPGSSIKPVTYLTAFTQGYSPATYVSDIKTCFPGGAGQPDYCPVNWDGKYWGPMSIRTALANSRNIPAVKMLQAVGMSNMIDMAHTLGVTTLNEQDRYGLSLTLGGGEVRPFDLAQVYSVFAALGKKHDLTPFLKVEDPNGKILLEYKDSAKEVVKSEYVYLLNDILSDANTRKTTFGNSLEIGRPLAVKTGTTNDNKDAWTAAYTPQLVTVVWVGNFNKEPMNGVMGSTGATPIMKAIMSKWHTGKPIENWEKPGKVVLKTVDNLSGLIPQEGKGYPVREEKFAKGSEPTKIDDFHITVKVCKEDTAKLATQYHIDNNLYEERTFINLRDIVSAWQPFTDSWMADRRGEGYGAPPTEKCQIVVADQPTVAPIVTYVDPVPTSPLTANTFVLGVKAYSTERITKVEFYWDDVLVYSTNSEPYQATYDLTSFSDAKLTSSGVHVARVTAYDAKGEKTSKDLSLEISSPTTPVITATPISN